MYTQNKMMRFQHQPSNRVSAYSLSQCPIETQIRTNSQVHQNSSTKFTSTQQFALPKRGAQTRTLFADSEDQILSLFKIYFDLMGIESQIMSSSNKYLFKYIQVKRAGNNYAAVVLDIRMKGVLGLYIAAEKRINHDSQRIILVTTTPKRYLPMEKLKAMAIKENDILVLPFALSNLAEKLLH
jgi:two-component system, OmpR family, response regulator